MTSRTRRQLLGLGSAAILTPVRVGAAASAGGKARPVRVGLDLEISDPSSTSDDAIIAGAKVAARQINEQGGLLGGRPVELVVRDNRTLPPRGLENVRRFADDPDAVAYLCGKFSAVALAQLPMIHARQLLLLDPWAAADEIIAHDYSPGYAFRLSVRDSSAMSALLAEARRRGLRRLASVVPRNAWGRSVERALDAAAYRDGGIDLLPPRWFNWGGSDAPETAVEGLLRERPDAVVLVANEEEGAQFIRRLNGDAALAGLPILAHWGILGGPVHRLTGLDLSRIDLSVIGTTDLGRPVPPGPRRALLLGAAEFGVDDPRKIPSPPGFAHAHDLMHLLAAAIRLAGTASRPAVRDALEHLPPYEGLVRPYQRAFAPLRHEALEPADIRLFRFAPDGTLRAAPDTPVADGRGRPRS